MWHILAFLCYAFAVVDFGLSWFGIDITGVSWSPLVAGGVGALFSWIGDQNSKESAVEDLDVDKADNIESSDEDVDLDLDL